ncbi:unnamed protein product, partial [Amoebophrya sp. A120]
GGPSAPAGGAAGLGKVRLRKLPGLTSGRPRGGAHPAAAFQFHPVEPDGRHRVRRADEPERLPVDSGHGGDGRGIVFPSTLPTNWSRLVCVATAMLLFLGEELQAGQPPPRMRLRIRATALRDLVAQVGQAVCSIMQPGGYRREWERREHYEEHGVEEKAEERAPGNVWGHTPGTGPTSLAPLRGARQGKRPPCLTPLAPIIFFCRVPQRARSLQGRGPARRRRIL